MPASQQDKLITAKEVAELTGLSVGAVYHGEAETAELLRIRLGRWAHSGSGIRDPCGFGRL